MDKERAKLLAHMSKNNLTHLQVLANSMWNEYYSNPGSKYGGADGAIRILSEYMIALPDPHVALTWMCENCTIASETAKKLCMQHVRTLYV